MLTFHKAKIERSVLAAKYQPNTVDNDHNVSQWRNWKSTELCEKCQRPMCDHGRYPTANGFVIICPGDWFVVDADDKSFIGVFPDIKFHEMVKVESD